MAIGVFLLGFVGLLIATIVASARVGMTAVGLWFLGFMGMLAASAIALPATNLGEIKPPVVIAIGCVGLALMVVGTAIGSRALKVHAIKRSGRS